MSFQNKKLMSLWLLFVGGKQAIVYCQNEIMNDTYDTNIPKAANNLRALTSIQLVWFYFKIQ